jgi:hypothetical protein
MIALNSIEGLVVGSAGSMVLDSMIKWATENQTGLTELVPYGVVMGPIIDSRYGAVAKKYIPICNGIRSSFDKMMTNVL